VLILLPPSEKKSTQPGPAIEVYTGVLYKALDWLSLNKESQARGQKSIAIISAKYGVLQPLDRIEPYKQKIDSASMRAQVTETLSARKATLVIDCRSSTYKGVWTPPAQTCVEIKVFINHDGEKKVITHMSKKTRGEVTRLLLQSSSIPTNPQELFGVISTIFECELVAPIQSGPWVLEVGSLRPQLAKGYLHESSV